MKYKITGLVAALLLFFSAGAQTLSDVGKIVLSVVMPENLEGLTASQLSKLESKITQITTRAGLAANSYNQTFVIYPKFAIYESQVVEGGMQNITVLTAELSLYILQTTTNVLFASVSKPLKGSGKSREAAITQLISQIPVSDKAFAVFIDEGKQKIIQYYETNCNNIVKKADSYIQRQQYDQALGLLMSVPEEVSACYDKILNKAIDTHQALLTQICSEKMLQAKTMLATKNYEGTLGVLSEIDPSAVCFKEALAMVQSIENRISEAEKQQWDFRMKQYEDARNLKQQQHERSLEQQRNANELERQRIDAIKEVAIAYYKSQPTTVNYSLFEK
jgi:hypothetical protein